MEQKSGSENYPKIHYLKGDSSNWWTGSLSKLINYCLKKECDYILSLNADVVLDSSDVYRLVKVQLRKIMQLLHRSCRY